MAYLGLVTGGYQGRGVQGACAGVRYEATSGRWKLIPCMVSPFSIVTFCNSEKNMNEIDRGHCIYHNLCNLPCLSDRRTHSIGI